MGKLFYIMGKSASGKDTIYQRLLRNPEFSLERLVIYTTRPIRDGELDGREYHFVTEEDFQKLKAAGKIIEDRGYETVYGLWRYFTADNMDLEEKNYLGIGTLESYEKLKAYYGEEKIRPIYIEVEDGERLSRALNRERMQESPKYEELCRRFLSDAKDFSGEKLKEAGITRRFVNQDLDETEEEIRRAILEDR